MHAARVHGAGCTRCGQESGHSHLNLEILIYPRGVTSLGPLGSHHPTIQSPNHPITQASNQSPNQSPNRPITQSSSHPVIQSSSHLPTWPNHPAAPNYLLITCTRTAWLSSRTSSYSEHFLTYLPTYWLTHLVSLGALLTGHLSQASTCRHCVTYCCTTCPPTWPAMCMRRGARRGEGAKARPSTDIIHTV